MKWIGRAFAALLLVVVGVAAFGFWVFEPWAERRPMRTWAETLKVTGLGGSDREALADAFRNWDRDFPVGVLKAAPRPHEFEWALAELQEPADERSGYAMQFWVPPAYDGEFYGAGAFGQYVWVDTRRGVVIAQFAAQAPGDLDERERDAAFRAVAASVSAD